MIHVGVTIPDNGLQDLRVAPNGRPAARSGGPYTGRGCEHGWAVRRQDPQASYSSGNRA
jgi:hypothetical protein